jgi:hypothetical protein
MLLTAAALPPIILEVQISVAENVLGAQLGYYIFSFSVSTTCSGGL